MALFSIFALFGLLFQSPAQAADDRYFQYSATDAVNPDAFNLGFDLTSIQVALTSNGYIQFFAMLSPGIDANQLINGITVGFLIDSDGNSGSELAFDTSGVNYSGSSRTWVDVYDMHNSPSTKLPDCLGGTWITSGKDAIAFEIRAKCLGTSPSASVIAYVTDGKIYDWAPDLTGFKFKTNYLSTKSCSSKAKDTKFTFSSIQYICNLKNGKWIWVDYAPIAAAKAKYLTEKAFYKCGLNTNTLGAALTDKGKTLVLNHVYKYFVTETEFTCVSNTLGMPSSVSSQLGMTRALDGIQRTKWGKISAIWNYQSDNGLGITFTYN